jgi:Pyrimidine dimer DNA glycosylase/Protein of unknown function (DUF1722)
MRIWDINPGYLNRQSLLGEHRELHGIVSIIVNGKKGYSKHPETLRWLSYGWALKKRHQLLSAEMSLRSYKDNSPVVIKKNEGQWPKDYIDKPVTQFIILSKKYQDKEQGRIPLPKNSQQLWSQHKYSVLARNVNLYKKIGQTVSTMSPKDDFSILAMELTELLRKEPSQGGIKNALHHMWGYVSDTFSNSVAKIEQWPLYRLLEEIQRCALVSKESYLMSSTALSELKTWIK